MEKRARNLFALAVTLGLASGSLACHRSEEASPAAKGDSPTQGRQLPSDSLVPGAGGSPKPDMGASTAADTGTQPPPPSEDSGDDDPSAHADPCTADEHEPDDTPEEAEAHPAIHNILPIEIANRTACGFEQDVIWAGRVDSGGKAATVLTWDAKVGALDLALLDGNGQAIAKLDVASKQAGRIELAVNEYYGAYFYIQVTNAGSAAIPYSLKVVAQVFGP